MPAKFDRLSSLGFFLGEECRVANGYEAPTMYQALCQAFSLLFLAESSLCHGIYHLHFTRDGAESESRETVA